ncbi:cupin domain-containing protein [Mycolicibacterium vaccae]|uniref:cupin domain-containing protein n=1 Tax=Mycolicibacterium vaccae TaxID=1810 RepID=UPI003CF48B56
MLSRCIGIDPAEFARTYWGRLPLLTRSGALPRDFDDLLSAPAVDELLAERGVRAPFIRLAKDGSVLARDCYLGPAGFGAEVTDQVDSAKVLAQFAAGASIVLQGLHRLWPPVIDFARTLVDDLGHPVQTNAYITPPAHRGFEPHYDVHDVFVLQTSGQKHWTVHAPVHVDPLPSQPWTGHRDAVTRRAAEEPVIDTVLSPGDALYLPRGWVHSARALDTVSIHLTVGVAPTTKLDVLRTLIDQLAAQEQYRGSLPLGGDPADRDEMTATATKYLAELMETLRDGTTELGEGMAERLAQRYAEQTRPVAVRPLAAFAASSNAATVAVRWRHGLVARVEDGDGRVRLCLPDRTIEFPGVCAEAVRALHRGRSARADTLPGLDAADGAVVIGRLLREGVVAHIDSVDSVDDDSTA